METVVKPNLRPKTVEANLSLTRTHIIPALGKIKLSQLRPDHLQNLYSQILEKGLSKRTAQFVHTIIHKSLRQGVKWGFVVNNVADLVIAPKPSRRPPSVYDTNQVIQFLDSVKEDRFFCLFVLAVYGGFREGEVLGIHAENCQLEQGTINVIHAVQYQIGKGVVVTELKTESSRRPVKLPAFPLKVLKDHLNQTGIKKGLLFTTASGKPINPRFLVKAFKKAISDAGLPNIRFHDLRHTSATLLLSAKVHPKVVQERLGHASITLTLNTYSHVIPSMQDEAAEKLDKLLSHP